MKQFLHDNWFIVFIIGVDAIVMNYIFKKFKSTMEGVWEDLFEKKNDENGKKITNSTIKNLFIFYILIIVLFSIVFFLYWLYKKFDINLLIAFAIIIAGNAIIALFTQILHSVILKNIAPAKNLAEETQNKERAFSYFNFQECFIRCFAGLLEMIFYTISFAIGRVELIAGYLILKTLSIWRVEDPKKEGVHAAVLRIAVVMSLIFSLWASYYSFYFLKDLNIFVLDKHFLFR